MFCKPAPWTRLLPGDVSAKDFEPRYGGNGLTRCVPIPATLNFEMLLYKKLATSPASQQQGPPFKHLKAV
ncbi:hypothetical protein AV530_018364 [Patagioenas fasciata monilis]|uniref:Uncharacterized protein n=1 Tax=Patagioenas fasciata monilis TaxID=372326 RepID=A0A1V4JRN1_PATFA|nr:hypothetical protein AV530_018364 [Patagioenas fasciata monilis]